MADAVELLFGTPNLDAVKASVLGLIPIFDRVARQGKTSWDRAAKERVKAEEEASERVKKTNDDTTKAKDKAARDQAAAAKRAANEEIRIKNQVNDLEVRAYQQAERAKTREVEAEANKRKRLVEGEARAAEATLQRRSRGFGSVMGGATGRVLGMAGRVAAVAGALGGGFAIGDALQAGIQQEKTAGVIFRGADNKGGVGSQKEVQQMASATAIKTGSTAEDVLGGLDVFVRKTGDLGAAKTMLTDMAKLSAAVGTEFTDMANTTAEVQNQLGDSAKTMEVMRALAGQGRTGAIDMKDLGQYGGRLASSAAQYAGSLTSNIETFGAIAQLAKRRGGATDAAEATEAAARIGSDVTKHEDKFQAVGVSVYSDSSHTKLRNAEDIITDAVVKTKGDLGKLHDLFGERSIKAVTGAQVLYANAGGGSAGEAAIRSEFAGLKSKSLTEGDVDEGVQGRLAENSALLNNAMTRFHTEMNEKLLPKLPGMIDQFTTLIPALARMADGVMSMIPSLDKIYPAVDMFANAMTSHPWATVIGAAFTAEIAKAGISSAIGFGFSKIAEGALRLFGKTTTAVANISAGVVNVASGGGGPPKPSPDGSSAPSGSGGPGSQGVPSMLGKMFSTVALVEEASGKVRDMVGSKYSNEATNLINGTTDLATRIRAGTASPDEIEEGKSRLATIHRTFDSGTKFKNESYLDSLGADARATAGDVFGGGGAATEQRERDRASAASLDKLAAAATTLETALNAATGAATAMAEAGPKGNGTNGTTEPKGDNP